MIKYKDEVIICSSCEQKVKPIKLIIPTHVGCPECFSVVRTNERKHQQTS